MKKAIVVGAGINGLASAWALVRRGWQVEILEAGPVPNPLSASWDFHRLIRAHYPGKPGYAVRIPAAFAAWRDLWEDLGAEHYVERGIIALSRQPDDWTDRCEDTMRRSGLDYLKLTPREVDAFGVFETDGVRHGLMTRTGGVLLADRIVSGLIAWLWDRGAEIRPETRVDSVDFANGVVTTSAGEHRGDAVILATGVGLTRLVPDLENRFHARRSTVVYMMPPEHLRGAWDKAPCWVDLGGEDDLWGMPTVNDLPLKIGYGMHTRPGNPDTEREISNADSDMIIGAYRDKFKEIEGFTTGSVVANFYLMEKDERFFLQGRGRTWIIAADSGHAFKFGALTGLDVAEAVETGDPGGRISRRVAGLM